MPSTIDLDTRSPKKGLRLLASDNLLRPQRLWTRVEVLSRPSPGPKAPGVYAWYFRKVDNLVPSLDCLAAGEFRLLYIGISP